MKSHILSKLTRKVERPGHLRKRLRRISGSPKARATAALLPLLAIGLVAARKIAARR